MKLVIVVVIKTDGEPHYFGPFPNGEEATKWGFDNCRGFEWYWQDLCPVNQPETE